MYRSLFLQCVCVILLEKKAIIKEAGDKSAMRRVERQICLSTYVCVYQSPPSSGVGQPSIPL